MKHQYLKKSILFLSILTITYAGTFQARAVEEPPYAEEFRPLYEKVLTIKPNIKVDAYQEIVKDGDQWVTVEPNKESENPQNVNRCNFALGSYYRRVYIGAHAWRFIGINKSADDFVHNFTVSMQSLEKLIFGYDKKCLNEGNCEFVINIGNIAIEDEWYKGREIQLTGHLENYQIVPTGISFKIPNENYHKNANDDFTAGLKRLFASLSNEQAKEKELFEDLNCRAGTVEISKRKVSVKNSGKIDPLDNESDSKTAAVDDTPISSQKEVSSEAIEQKTETSSTASK